MRTIELKSPVYTAYLLRILLCICMLVLAGQCAMAQERYVQTITGKIISNDSCRTVDPVYVNAEAWSKRENDLSVKNVITFELRQDTGIYYYARPFSCTLKFDLQYNDEHQGSHELSDLQLKVTFDTTSGGSYKGVAMYKFEGGYSVRVKVKSISSPELGGQDSLPAIFRIKDEIFINRKFSFSTVNTDVTRYALLNGGRQIKINWMTTYNYPGAEFYDLEWTYYGDSSTVAKNIRSTHNVGQIEAGKYSISPDEMEEYFLNNNTRITTSDKEFLMNIPYPSGFVLYRVRGARINSLTGEREEGDWTYKAYASGGNDESRSIVLLTNDHAATLTYQYNALFAEEGKRNEVVSYYDGALKTRQIVTLNNSVNRAIVGETVYDVMGRHAVDIMPNPELDSTIHFFPGLNSNRQGIPYSYKDLLNADDTCNTLPQPLTDVSGSGRYYSPNNPFIDQFPNKYVPDAEGYPLVMTSFTPDNTGRLREVGNSGIDFQPGHGHTTKYFYGNADALELDRLFGSEVGNAAHYTKNMKLDPNGQITVTYQDAHGRIVATALAGPRPDNLYGLKESEGSTVNVTKQLAKPENTVKDVNAFTVTSSTTLMIPMAGDYHFNYSFDPQSVRTAACESSVTDICADCYYDLQIIISDECGVPLHTEIKPAVLSGLDTLCETTAPFIDGSFNLILPIGEYQVTYQLVASKLAAEYYDAAYQRQNTCISSLDDFKRKFLAKADFTGCYSDCESCKTSLDTKEVFTNRYLELLKSEDLFPDNSDRAYAGQLYDSLYFNCAERCNNSNTNSCQDTYDLLLMDVSPGGQYAMYDYDALEDLSLSVLQQDTVNVLRFYNKVTDYLDEDGNPAKVQNEAGNIVSPQDLNIREFIRNFSPSWANSLVKYHPEYCFYKWCSIISTSKNFDEKLNYIDDVTFAKESGWFDRADPLALLKKDPFFATGAAGAARYTTMKNVLEHFSKTLQTNIQGGDADILQVIKYLVYCNKDSTITSFANCAGPLDCNAGLDEPLEWLLYKNFYLTEKAKQVAIARKSSTDPIIRDCKNCFIGYAMGECDPLTDPECSTYQQAVSVMGVCKDYYSNNDPRKALYAAKSRQFMDDVAGDGIVTQLSSKTIQELRDSLDQQLSTQLLITCQNNCEAQADNWMKSLQYCENLINGTDSTKYKALRSGLIEVCKKGCDANHPYGATSITPGTSNIDNNFEAVITRVLGAAAVKDSCTALLISSPLPYEAQDTGINSIEAFDACTCENLQALQAEYEQRGGAGGFLSFLKKKFGRGFYLTQDELNILINKCGGDECVTASQLPTSLPDALRCKNCISCDNLNALVAGFNTTHPGLVIGTSIYETSIANYLNQTLRFSLTYSEYWDFMHRCSIAEYETNDNSVSCTDFTKAYNHFQQFKPDYYANPNGDTTITSRFQENITTWLNIELNRNLPFTAYLAAAARCRINIIAPHDSIPVICDGVINPGDTIFGCPVSVADCCSVDNYIQQFKTAYPQGVNARLVAYYFEMKRKQWCAPVGLPTVSFRGAYTILKDYFIKTLKFPRSSIVDVTTSGTTVTIGSTFDCGLSYNFGPSSALVDNEVYRLCNHSPAMTVELDSLSCFRSQFKMALVNAGLAHQEYLDSIRNEYQEIYLSRCMSVQPKLTMTGDLYEYHYTLYYYDQSGQLVKTVPPAGVKLLTNAEIAKVEHDRPYNKPECYDVSDTLRFNGGGYIPLANLLSNRLGADYGFESWISANSFTSNEAIFSEEVKISSPERYIDSIRTIPAFTGTKGVSCYIRDNRIWLRIGSKPAYYPDTLFQTQTAVSTSAINNVLIAGKWGHIVVNGTGSATEPFQVYINGKAIALTYSRRVDTLGTAPIADGNAEFRLGAALINNNWSYYSGYMKHFRFYNRQLKYPEVILNRDNTCGFPVNEGGLLIWAPMNEGRDTSKLNDRIQNLEMATVNPSGFSWMRHHDPVYPQHTLVSTYHYNSFDKPVMQYAPDSDTSRIWYDKAGRVIASRSAEQFHPVNGGESDRYSYTKYDSLGRLIETGEKSGASLSAVNTLNESEVQQWLNTGSRRQINKRIFDDAIPDLGITQSNLRRRMASITIDHDGNGIYENATHYSYDIYGNIKSVWHELPLLGMKKIEYEYDLMSGNTNKIIYQQGQKDQFYYRHLYDVSNKLTESSTSADGLIWQRDAAYIYYLHGILARTEIGQYQVQGIDYVYTLQGNLKGLNSAFLDVDQDMANDGKKDTRFANFARDVMALTLGYHNNDYKPAGGTTISAFNNRYISPSVLGIGNDQFDGNISSSSLALSRLDNATVKGYGYAYDQLGRMVQAQQHNVNTQWIAEDNYREAIGYDASGNIMNYLRNGTNQQGKQQSMDNLTYHYQSGTNKLNHVTDAVGATSDYENDIENQQLNNYSYDRNGSMIKDVSGKMDNVNWNIYGKIDRFTNAGGTTSYSYNGEGDRIIEDVNGDKRYFVRDLRGNILGIYNISGDVIRWKEQYLYGSSRLGLLRQDINLTSVSTGEEQDSIIRGSRLYEMSNHSGSVITVISDKKIGISTDMQRVDYFVADVLQQQDYYSFGMIQSERQFSLADNSYRYGFQGQEKGTAENNYTAGFWEYDARLGRRWNVDPVDVHSQSVYSVFNNNPLLFTDPAGLYSSKEKAEKYRQRALKAGRDVSEVYQRPEQGDWVFAESYNVRGRYSDGGYIITAVSHVHSNERYFGGSFRRTRDFLKDLNPFCKPEAYVGFVIKTEVSTKDIPAVQKLTGGLPITLLKDAKLVVPYGGFQYKYGYTGDEWKGEGNFVDGTQTYINVKYKNMDIRVMPLNGIGGDYAPGARMLYTFGKGLITVPIGDVPVPIGEWKLQGDFTGNTAGKFTVGVRGVAETFALPSFKKGESGVKLEVNGGFRLQFKKPDYWNNPL